MDVKGTTVRKKGRASGETEGILVSGMSTVFVNDFKSPFKYQFDYCYEIKSKNANEKFFEPGDSGSSVYLIDRKGKKDTNWNCICSSSGWNRVCMQN